MGVTGLWTVVAPTARPTKLETLNRKRLAVDASIWIYQFLKAVRDKEGNALRNSHVVGFFRRICKLLYFGIKPVFVFDGGAPVLKRETVRGRARRREGRREDAARTAGKLLALQMARAAEEENKRRAADRERTPIEEELPEDEELVYVDEVGMNRKERQVGRGFKRTDQYHLPDLDVSIESMGAPNDPRIMSQAELEEYARQFHSGEEISFYDFSKIDFESPFFLSLPPGDRYNILNAARLRSRLRMGHSKEQLDAMFPDRMAFSKFQIERVKERNELTQRLMHINGGTDDFLNQGGRIAGEKGKEYVLVKNDGVEGGWALGVVSNKRGTKVEDAIDLEEGDKDEMEGLSSNSEEEFEDVAIEGLNRIPKVWQRKQRQELDYDPKYYDAAEEIARKRRSVYAARQAAAASRENQTDIAALPEEDESDSLFVQPHGDIHDEDDEDNALFEDVNTAATQDHGYDDDDDDDDDDDLDLAIAMSLQDKDAEGHAESGGLLPGQHAMNDSTPGKSRQPESANQNNDDDDDLDLQAVLANSRKSKYKSPPTIRPRSPVFSAQDNTPQNGFGGVLPFESLNLGHSILGKKKAKKVEESLSGGFDKRLGDDAFRKERPAQPMPSWFEAAPSTNDMRHDHDEAQDDDSDHHINHGREDRDRRETLLRHHTTEIIDLEAPDTSHAAPIILDDSTGEGEDESVAGSVAESTQSIMNKETRQQELELTKKKHEDEQREMRYKLAQEIADAQVDSEDEMQIGQTANNMQAVAPASSESSNIITSVAQDMPDVPKALNVNDNEEMVEWSDSEPDNPTPADSKMASPVGFMHDNDDDEEVDFEDVSAPVISKQAISSTEEQGSMNAADIAMTSRYIMADADEETPEEVNDDAANQGEQYFSDSEEELMRQLAVEAEEHARFASSLNNKTPLEAARDYENELKQLRNQQKKDRRDADEVTQVMVQECQALLRLFGLPYITAPMEAEAQCAELVTLGLVDGIVTDDSDIFLFGGTRVYKNMFNAAKFVECYVAGDLEKEYDLDRVKLIRFAHLLGSDYTEGIPGVGPVTALEILTDFADLTEFREWCKRVQLGRPVDLEDQLSTPFRRKFRNTAQKRIFLPPNFPDQRVDSAYLKPEVDHDPQEFQWGVPDLDKLRSFLMATIGWSQDRTDEVLVPVVRDMNKRVAEGTQANITRFFAGGVGVGAQQLQGTSGLRARESGRMERAYKRLRGEAARKRRGDVEEEMNDRPEDEEERMPVATPEKKNNRASRKTRKPAESDSDGHGNEEDEFNPKRAKVPRKRRKKTTAVETHATDGE